MTSQITMDEWRAELDSLAGDDDGMTMAELAKMAGTSVRAMHKKIRRGVLSGKYIKGKARRVSRAGSTITVPVYRVIK